MTTALKARNSLSRIDTALPFAGSVGDVDHHLHARVHGAEDRIFTDFVEGDGGGLTGRLRSGVEIGSRPDRHDVVRDGVVIGEDDDIALFDGDGTLREDLALLSDRPLRGEGHSATT